VPGRARADTEETAVAIAPEKPGTQSKPEKPPKPSKLAELREQHPWVDHVMRAAASYKENHGDHYGAAVTYFSVLALFPLLMVGFAAGALVLARNPELLMQIKNQITSAAPGGLGQTLGQVVDSAIKSGSTVGIFGLLTALYSGLGWMSNLREALSAQWGQRENTPPFPRKLAVDLGALVGLGLALLLSMAVIGATGMAKQILGWLGITAVPWLAPVISGVGLLFSLLANALLLLWVIARLPREPVTWRSAGKAALIGAVGLLIIQRVMFIYLAKVTASPAGALFGPILGLMIFIFTVSRFILLLTAWAATDEDNIVAQPTPAPGPAVIRSEVTVHRGPGAGATAGLLGAGAVAGAVGVVGALVARRKS
jgi:membrane protein